MQSDILKMYNVKRDLLPLRIRAIKRPLRAHLLAVLGISATNGEAPTDERTQVAFLCKAA